jgi:hypothetical protein
MGTRDRLRFGEAGVNVRRDRRRVPRNGANSISQYPRRSSPAAAHWADHKRCENSCNSLTDAFALLGCLVRKAVRRPLSTACIEDNLHAPATRINQLVLRTVYVRHRARARSRRVGTGAE